MRHLAIGAVISMGLTGLVAIGIASAAEHIERGSVREELWAIPSAIPMLAYVVRPLGGGSNLLVVMNHGISLDPTERSLFSVD